MFGATFEQVYCNKGSVPSHTGCQHADQCALHRPQVASTLTEDTRSVADQLGRQLMGVSQELQAQESTKADNVRGRGGARGAKSSR